LKKDGFLLVNSKKPPEIIKRELQQEVMKVFTVDASTISTLVYGPTSIPITSVILLGSFAAMTQEVKLNSLFTVLEKFFRPTQLDSNRRALELGHEQVRGLNED
jgi:Pyruvate/2-oxoacid:ferredoxin oxidoreductase gamma subunit